MTEADWIIGALLARDPELARAHLMRGIVASRMRRPADAVRHLTRALELEPTSFDAALFLATAHRTAGDLAAAIQSAELAVSLGPNNTLAHAELGLVYFYASRLEEAEEHLRLAAQSATEDRQVQLTLAQCLEHRGKLADARRVISEFLERTAVPADELAQMAPRLLVQGTPNVAVEVLFAAVARGPSSMGARARLAKALIEANRGTEAVAALNDPVLTRSSMADGETQGILAGALPSVGRLAESRALFARAMTKPSGGPFAFYGYTHSGRATEADRGAIKAAEDRLGAGRLGPGERAYLHFGLGRAYEDLGEYETAMRQYDAANRAERAEKPTALAFNRTQYAEMFDRMIAALSPEVMAAGAAGNSSDFPILVVGMIRSGTTLVEQILASHPEVGGAGEVPFWVTNGPDLVDSASGDPRTERFAEAASRYLGVLSSTCPGRSRVVDKMPGNYNLLGLIHLALPNARIIHTRRNPLDTCISIHTTHNRAISEFGNDRGNLVFGYRQYERLMAHWRRVLPADRFLEVDYEDLVSDTEPTVLRMLEFCGLDWNDACLRQQDSPRSVSTPSSWQVRQPVYRSSVDRWRRFEPWLGEFRELLGN